jgi:hypothetical protein
MTFARLFLFKKSPGAIPYAWLACLLLALAALPAAAKVESLALFIGVDEGLAADRSLKYASRDAMRMAQVIRELGTYDKDRIYLLSNPSLDRVLSTLGEMRGRIMELKKSGVQTSVLLYYSGHGSAQGLHVRGKRFDREDVNAMLESLESDLKVVILDACESGDFLRRKGGRLLENRQIVKEDQLRSTGTIVLSSSSRGEQAQESEDYKGAVFSHHLINGLRGLADYNADGRVTLLEAFDYARASTRMEEIQGAAGKQNPSFDFDVVGESDPVLSRLERVRSRILFRRMPATGMEVYNAQTLELEHRLWMTSKDSAWYYLPSGKFILRYPDRDGWRVRNVDLTWTPEIAVGPEDFRLLPRSLLGRKGGVGASLDVHGLQIAGRSAPPFLAAPLFGAEYVFRTFALKHHVGFFYGRRTGEEGSNGLEIDTDLYRVGYSLRKPILAFSYFQLQAGLDAAWHRANQVLRDTRFGSDPPMGPDGRPMPLRWETGAHVLEGGLPLELEIYFPGRFWLGLSGTASIYRYRDGGTGKSDLHPAFQPGLTFGRQF